MQETSDVKRSQSVTWLPQCHCSHTQLNCPRAANTMSSSPMCLSHAPVTWRKSPSADQIEGVWSLLQITVPWDNLRKVSQGHGRVDNM
ncbi:hypothetical protein BaRGS_00006346 [Batillaria attramentaria]|uniref:Uncharacterized protein n=1 Tax=Batillaria attramentaria TaxID=370345 RepID=A0ABD0LT96_9CAEN